MLRGTFAGFRSIVEKKRAPEAYAETKRGGKSLEKRECEECFFYGHPPDAPENAEKECMSVPTEEEKDLPWLCERYSDLEDLTL